MSKMRTASTQNPQHNRSEEFHHRTRSAERTRSIFSDKIKLKGQISRPTPFPSYGELVRMTRFTLHGPGVHRITRVHPLLFLFCQGHFG
jgi:hypothetical protein